MSDQKIRPGEPPCTCSTWWRDPDTGAEYDQGGGDRERRWSVDPDCPVHGGKAR